jgi:hypothetical protein
MKKTSLKSVTVTMSTVLLFTGVAILTFTNANAFGIASRANIKAGECADCVDGGKSCDNSNTATGISDGQSCDNGGHAEGSEVANCNGQGGRVKQSSKNWADSVDTDNAHACPAPSEAYVCTDTTPNKPGGLEWKKETGSCGTLATCDASGRTMNDSRCTPSPSPGE